MFSREIHKVLGWLFHPKVPTWGVDYVTYMIFKPLNRLFEIHDKIYLQHVSYHTKMTKIDKTAERIGEIFNQLKNVPTHNIQRIVREEVPRIQEKLKNYIEEHK
jgi:t-SNARE complex subunit (syntaxin)